MRTTIVRGAFAALLIVGAACGPSDPTSPPIPNSQPVTTAPVSPTSTFPEPIGPSRTFVFLHQVSYPVSGYTTYSRFVLYDNHAFALRYEGLSSEYRGGYTESNGVIAFEWEGWSRAGAWGATGTLNGDTLTVRYNIIMALTDFEDAVYVLER